MKEYFLELLQNLDKLCGLKQYEKLYQSENRNQEITTLLDILCRVTDMFAYIPDASKKKIISEAVITDLEFQGLNARIVYKWLNLKKDTYFQEIAHIPSGNDSEPLTGDARDARLKEWQEALNRLTIEKTKPVPYEKVRAIETHTASGYKVDHDYAARQEKHLRYIKKNYIMEGDKSKPGPNWVSEETWNENNF